VVYISNYDKAKKDDDNLVPQEKSEASREDENRSMSFNEHFSCNSTTSMQKTEDERETICDDNASKLENGYATIPDGPKSKDKTGDEYVHLDEETRAAQDPLESLDMQPMQLILFFATVGEIDESFGSENSKGV
jgi:hypothetical protein